MYSAYCTYSVQTTIKFITDMYVFLTHASFISEIHKTSYQENSLLISKFQRKVIMSDNKGVSTTNIFLRDVGSQGRGSGREGVIPHSGPLHPQYASEAARLPARERRREGEEDHGWAGGGYTPLSESRSCLGGSLRILVLFSGFWPLWLVPSESS